MITQSKSTIAFAEKKAAIAAIVATTATKNVSLANAEAAALAKEVVKAPKAAPVTTAALAATEMIVTPETGTKIATAVMVIAATTMVATMAPEIASAMYISFT